MMDSVFKITRVAAYAVLITVGVVIAAIGMFVVVDNYRLEKRATAVRAFIKQFEVGNSSKEFIKSARNLDADEFDLYESNSKAESNTDEHMKQILTRKDLSVSTMDPEILDSNGGRKLFEKRVDLLEQKFKSMKSGSAHVQLTLVPPFTRANITINFANGIVEKVRVWQLD